jgi:monodehydroascorbate reductase (NADH)
VISADVRRKTLLTGTGETISYKTLIIATGARVLDLFVLLFIFCSKFNSS